MTLTNNEADAKIAEVREEFTQFIYRVSHDLGAPLRHIDGFSKLLINDLGDQLDEKNYERLKHIVAASERAKSLMQDLLAFSRLNTRLEEKTLFPLAQCFTLGLAQAKQNHKDVSLTITHDEFPELVVDSAQCVQLFYHLLDNAKKFASKERESMLHISVEKLDDGAWCFAFCDNGVGIEEKQIATACDFFQKGCSIETYSGNGIGLAIAKKIVSRHEGDITIENNQDYGVTVKITLKG